MEAREVEFMQVFKVAQSWQLLISPLFCTLTTKKSTLILTFHSVDGDCMHVCPQDTCALFSKYIKQQKTNGFQHIGPAECHLLGTHYADSPCALSVLEPLKRL